MKSVSLVFYKTLFTEPKSWRPKANGLEEGLFLPALRKVDKTNMEWAFTEEEVVKALFDCCGDKALVFTACLWLFFNQIGIR